MNRQAMPGRRADNRGSSVKRAPGTNGFALDLLPGWWFPPAVAVGGLIWLRIAALVL